MSTKSIIPSSTGLRNIHLSVSDVENNFSFIICNKNIKMNKFFVEFISPIVSKNIFSDPTINSVKFENLCNDNINYFYHISDDIFTDEIIYLLHQLSSGYSISINEEQSFKLQFISIILGNEELYSKLNENFPLKLTESNINVYLQNLRKIYYCSQISKDFELTAIIDFLSKNFYLLDKFKLLKQPKSILYSIL